MERAQRTRCILPHAYGGGLKPVLSDLPNSIPTEEQYAPTLVGITMERNRWAACQQLGGEEQLAQMAPPAALAIRVQTPAMTFNGHPSL